MMITKYEIPIEDEFTLQICSSSKFLSVQIQKGKPVIWLQENTAYPKMEKKFRIYGTGFELRDAVREIYLGTIQIDNLVWHLYEVM